jgi:hypothetical protein
MRGMDRRAFLQASVLTAAEIALPDLQAQKHEDPPVPETSIGKILEIRRNFTRVTAASAAFATQRYAP